MATIDTNGDINVTGSIKVNGVQVGATGPAGPQGETGPAGPNGADAVYDTAQAVISMQVFS